MATLNLKMRFVDGRTDTVAVAADATVAQLKADMASKAGVGADQLRVVFSGHVLKDEMTLASYGITDGCTVHVVKAATNNAQAQAATAAAARPGLATSGAASAGAANAGLVNRGGGPPSMAAMQQQMQQNPDMMRQILNSPLTDMMMRNPEFMRNMMMANPEMQALAERNPELAHLLNDPALLRQSLEIARNPSMMLEQQRNNDRAMQNIEMLPGGFDALRRMYTDVQEPLMAAQTNMTSGAGGAQRPTTGPGTPAPAATEINTTPLPNPWATPTRPSPASGGRPAGTGFPSATPPQPFGGAAPFGGTSPFPWAAPQFPPLWPGAAGMNAGPGLGADDDDDMNDPAFMQALMESMAPQQPTGSTVDSANAGAPRLPWGLPFWTPPPAPPVSVAPAPAASVDWTQYEARYTEQLAFMAEMGFRDKQANISALLAAGGNVDAAVDRMLASGVAPATQPPEGSGGAAPP